MPHGSGSDARNFESQLSIDSETHAEIELRRLEQNSLKIQYETWQAVCTNIYSAFQSIARDRDTGTYFNAQDEIKAHNLSKAYNAIKLLTPDNENNVLIEEVVLKVTCKLLDREDLIIPVHIREKMQWLINEQLIRNELIESFENRFPMSNVIDKFQENLEHICNSKIFIDVLSLIGAKLDNFLAQNLSEEEMTNIITDDYIAQNNIQIITNEEQESEASSLQPQPQQQAAPAQENIVRPATSDVPTRAHANPFMRPFLWIRNLLTRRGSYDVTTEPNPLAPRSEAPTATTTFVDPAQPTTRIPQATRAQNQVRPNSSTSRPQSPERDDHREITLI